MKKLAKQLIKSAAVSLASYTGPHRQSAKKPKLWVLMYHRVLPMSDKRYKLEEPGMIVTPDTFALHMREIKQHFDVIDLADWVKLKQTNQPLPPKACAITFDDGWADNYEYALPILQAEKVPATLFAVAEKIGSDFQFWPNIIMALLLGNSKIPQAMQLQPLFAKIFHVLPAKSTTIGREYAAAYIYQLKQFSDYEIFNALNDINWRSLLDDELPNALMSWEQLVAMQKTGSVNIGSHTCNHKRLTAALSDQELIHEITESKKILENKLSSNVDLFCFPNGDYNPRALELVQQSYSAAVTTQRGIIDADNCTIHELTRIGMHDEVSNSKKLFGSRLSGWL